MRVTRSVEHKGPIACQYLGHNSMDEKDSYTIYILLETSRHLSFVHHVEKDTDCCFRVTVHGGNCEISGDLRSSC